MKKRVLALAFSFIALVSTARAQQAEVVITLNEQFFDALLDAIFKNTTPPEFPISANGRESRVESRESRVGSRESFVSSFGEERRAVCNDVIRLKRENEGVRTSVRFREGKISAPIAFSGSYNPPLIGCVDFSGVAETNIELEFDSRKQALVGRATVLGVNLSGTGGIGSGILARLVQSSIDKKINPMQILQMEKVSFVVPVQNSGSLRMKAVGMRHDIANGALNVRIAYEFLKAD
jgi:hypothetical protein